MLSSVIQGWRLVGAGGVVFASLLGLGAVLRYQGLSAAADVAQLVSLAPLAASVVAWARNTSTGVLPSAERVDLAAAQLARVVRAQWRQEAETRGLLDPLVPLAVRWRPADSDLIDHTVNPAAVVVGSSAAARRLAALFNSLEQHRMVILGARGSGKTTLAMLLLLALIERRQQGDPVPMLFSAASWSPAHKDMRAWLTSELERVYGWLRGSPFGRGVALSLVTEGKVLPILDGLDELPRQNRAKVLVSINKALGPGDRLILTCREEEYRDAVRAGDVLTSAVAIVPEAIPVRDVITYLTSANPPHRLPAWQPVFRYLNRRKRGELVAAFSLALNVWLARIVYADPISIPAELTDVKRFPSSEEIEDHLLDRFLPAVFGSEPQPPTLPGQPSLQHHHWTADQARVWLGFLARHLVRLETPNFAWWRLRSALPAGGVSLTFGLLGGLLFGIASGLRHEAWYVFGPVGAVAFALASGFRTKPEPRYRDLQGFGYIRSGLRLLGRLCVIALVFWLAGGFVYGVICGLIGGIFVATLQWVGVPLNSDDSTGPAIFLRMHRRLFFRNLIVGGAGGAIIGVLASIEFERVGGILHSVVGGIAGGLAVGCVAASGWVGYRIAHTWLAIQGKLPWRLMQFLQDAHHRGALRQVGAVYQFRHDRLRERLATLPSRM